MTNRIKQKDLESLLADINKKAGFDNPEYSTIGAYCLSYAYGGVALDQYTSKQGGIRRISCDGYGTKKQLYTFLCGMLSA